MPIYRRALWLALVVISLTFTARAQQREVNGPTDPPGTLSILGFDPDTGEIGAAVQSRVFSVGNGVLWAEAGVGAVATQAIVNVNYGPRAMTLLKTGMAPQDIIKAILAGDPDETLRRTPWPKAGRQFAVMNAKGEFAAYTGPGATTWAGDKQGPHCTAQGNILAGEAVVQSMVDAFEKNAQTADGKPNHISFRLQAALEAGDAAGGDKRGKQSAAMIVVKKDGGVWLHNDVVLRLQVDDNPEPIKELGRLVQLAARQRR
jgi:uncharacterized Ntn-hydrolase superfamily protein